MKGERKSDQISNLDKKSKGDTSYMCIYIYIYRLFLLTDRQSVSKHLPLARSRSTPEQDRTLMSQLDEISRNVQYGI